MIPSDAPMQGFDGGHRTVGTPFAFRLPPTALECESPAGWVRRAAFEHAQPSMRVLAFQLGLNHRYLDVEAALGLARSSAAPGLEELELNSVRVSGQSAEVRGERFHARDWSIRTRRHCPGCLNESPHHRFYWDFAFFQTCPFHAAGMAGGPGEGRVTWTSTDLRVAQDGRWLPVPMERLPDERRGFEAYALGRMRVLGKTAAPLLDGLDLGEAHRAVRTIGLLATKSETGRRPRCPRFSRESAAILDAGFRALGGGRDDLELALREVAARARAAVGPRSEVGLDAMFGWTTDATENSRNDALALANRLMREIAAEDGRVRRGVVRSVGPVAEPKMLTIKEVGRRIGLAPLSTRRLIDHLAIVPDRMPGARLYFSADDVQVLQRAVATAIDGEATARKLGLRRIDLADLEAAGYLPSLPIRRPPLSAKLFAPADVDRVVEPFLALGKPSGRTVTFDALAGELRLRRGKLARSVLDGQRTPVGRDGCGKGFRALRFAPLPGARTVPSGVSATDAADRLGVTASTVFWLVKTGRLESDGGNLVRGGISPDAVEALARRYVTTKVFAVALGCVPAAAAALLSARGVRVLAVGPRCIGLADRRDVDRLLSDLREAIDGTGSANVMAAALPHVTQAAGRAEGRWRVPGAAAGGSLFMRTVDRKVSVVLSIERGHAELSVDCSGALSPRRSRILEARAPLLPPGFRILARSGETALVAIRRCTDGVFGDDDTAWLTEALDALSHFFSMRARDT